MKILLGLTGSVASVLYSKLIAELQTLGEVEVILTERAKHFANRNVIAEQLWKADIKLEPKIRVWTDEDEWTWEQEGSINATIDGKALSRPMNFTSNKWEKGDRVLHIDLRDKASVLVIAPCSANTLAKISNGICDNLLTSVARAWDFNRPFIIAPAMNTHMWNNPITERQLSKFVANGRNNSWVHPQTKMLACKTEGMGALADISNIVHEVKSSLRWKFPLGEYPTPSCSGIPQPGHPGAFKTQRKHHTHTGVDLYTTDGRAVYAVEDGTVVGIEDFTGSNQGSPWWEDTQCVLIEGASGVVCYGEVRLDSGPLSDGQLRVDSGVWVGKKVRRGEFIARVKRVLKLGKERPDIQGHSTSMLHIEVYKHGIYKAFEENNALGNLSDWNDLIDPTPFLMNAYGRPQELLY